MSGLRSVSLLLDEYIHSLTTQQSPAVPIKAEDLHVLVSTSLHCMTPLRTNLFCWRVQFCNCNCNCNEDDDDESINQSYSATNSYFKDHNVEEQLKGKTGVW